MYTGIRNKLFPQTNANYFYPVKSQIIAFLATDINVVLSDFRHENKQSLFNESIKFIKPTR
jgi:hypothetical protein